MARALVGGDFLGKSIAVLGAASLAVGLASVLVGLVEMIWSADQRRLPDFMPTQAIMVGDAFLAPKVFWGAMIAVIFIAAVLLVFRFWRGGVALRATASDQAAAYSMGINVPRVFSLAWVVSAMLAALSGIIVGSIGGISSTMGVFGLSVLVVVIVGGLDSVLGALVGGLCIGRRVQAAGHLHRAGGDPHDPALRPVRHPRDRKTLDMRPHAHHFVYSLPPEGVLASLGTARREA